MSKWIKGDEFWRGYARTYDGGRTWYPEIRVGHVDPPNTDGTYRCLMAGTMPGAEGKRNGGWLALYLDADLMHRTPEDALVSAKQAVNDQIASGAQRHPAGPTTESRIAQ